MVKRRRFSGGSTDKPAHGGGSISDATRYFGAGRMDDAEVICRRVLDAAPNRADALHLLALIYQRRGDNAACITLASQAIAVNAKRPAYHNTLGGALLEIGKTAQALASFRQALALDGRFAAANNNLGDILFRIGRVDDAAECFRKAVQSEPKQVSGRVNLAHALNELGDIEGAIANAKRARKINPKLTQAHIALANALKAKGDLESAKEAYRRAAEIDPGDPEIYYGAINLEPATENDPRLAKLEGLRRESRLPLDKAIHLQFVLGKIYAGLARYDDAFTAFRQGNVLRTQLATGLGQRFDARAHRSRVDALVNTFTAPFFESRRDFGHPSELPVFIVGMPRSGTSLVEQIVASHPEFHGGGELPHIGRIVGETVPGKQFTAWAPEMSREKACELGQSYAESLEALAPDAARVSDKMPGNVLFLGLIALMLPRARVIHCRRDPLDTCLSCYFHNFTQRHLFTNDLRDLAAYYREYRRTMDHWSEVLPLSVIDIDYEELVVDQEGQSRAIIDFLGLEWDEQCLRFHESRRTVTTASNVQVREKIYRRAVGRWRAYEDHLKPLIEELGPLAALV